MTHQLQLFAFPYSRKKNFWGITRQARSWNSSVPLQRAWVQFLVGEMRSHKLHSMAKKEKKENLLSRTHKGIYSRVWMHCSCCLITQSCLILCNHHGLQPTRLHCPWDFPGKNTGVGCHFLLQCGCIYLTYEPKSQRRWSFFIQREVRMLSFNCCHFISPDTQILHFSIGSLTQNSLSYSGTEQTKRRPECTLQTQLQ